MDLLDLPGWADEPEPRAVAVAGQSLLHSSALPPCADFHGRRSASAASSTFSLLAEVDGDGMRSPGRGVYGKSEPAGRGGGGGGGHLDLDGHSDGSEQLSDDLLELSFSSASERSTRSPSPASPTPPPLDLDSLDPHDDQVLAFSRSPSPTRLAKSHIQRLEAPVDVAVPIERPTSPTQAEMDAFFGYVDPLSAQPAFPPSNLGVKLPLAGCAGARRVEDAEGRGAADEDEERARETGSGAAWRLETDTEGGEASHRDGMAQLEAGEKVHRYFQLEPLPRISPATGQPWSKEERRLAIINALERLALSVLEQVVDAVAPKSTEQLSDSSQQQQPSHKQPMQKVEVVLVKRAAKADTTGQPERKKTQTIKFPRRYGHGGNLRLGSRELACLLKVVELVLEALKSGIICTKRDMYYRDVALFVKQAIVDSLVDDLAATLHVRRSELNVVATAKGLFAGAVKLILADGSELSSADQGVLIPSGAAIDRLELEKVKWVLVVEKDAVFQSLASSSLLDDDELGAGVLLTGKGYPDLATRELLKRLSDDLPSTPIFAVVDSDPHGLSILSVYAHGSALQSHDAHSLVVPRLQWLGVKGTEWAALGVDRDELLPLTKADRVKAQSMLKKDNLPDAWRRELEFMLHLQRKAEIQILSSTSTPSNAIQGSQLHGDSQQRQQTSPRLVDYVKKALWLALEDQEEEDEEEMLSQDAVDSA
ncbi:hypothetical protein JCM9279_001564 [Rhodotorula babjevae]